jgi:hypothetical protein
MMLPVHEGLGICGTSLSAQICLLPLGMTVLVRAIESARSALRRLKSTRNIQTFARGVEFHELRVFWMPPVLEGAVLVGSHPNH